MTLKCTVRTGEETLPHDSSDMNTSVQNAAFWPEGSLRERLCAKNQVNR